MTLAPAVADRELVARVLAEAEVATARARSWGWLERLQEWVSDSLRRLWEAVGSAIAEGAGLPGLTETLAAVALAAAAAVIAMGAVRTLRGRAGRRPAAPAAAALAVDAPPGGGERDAAGWREELERRLATGDAAGAVAALGWWLARRLHGDRAQPSWTGREAVARAGRRDLAPLVAQLDGFAYGPLRPAPSEVRRLAQAFGERLGERQEAVAG